MSLKLLPGEESRLIACLWVFDPAGGADNMPIEGQNSGSLKELLQFSQAIYGVNR